VIHDKECTDFGSDPVSCAYWHGVLPRCVAHHRASVTGNLKSDTHRSTFRILSPSDDQTEAI